MFQIYDQKLIVFACYSHFHELLPIVLGGLGRFTMMLKLIHVWGHDQKLVVFVFYGRFHELLPTILGFQGYLHVWELWQKTRIFCVIWPLSWSIDLIFWVLGRFTCFWVMAKNSCFLRLMAIFMSYCPQFWGSTALYMFESYESKLVVFVFYGRFHEPLPTIFGFQGQLHVWELWQKLVFFALYGHFHDL